MLNRVHARVARAILAGQLVRPAACPLCGTSGRKVEAHHEDYAKPLDVVWLCRSCHKTRHHL